MRHGPFIRTGLRIGFATAVTVAVAALTLVIWALHTVVPDSQAAQSFVALAGGFGGGALAARLGLCAARWWWNRTLPRTGLGPFDGINRN